MFCDLWKGGHRYFQSGKTNVFSSSRCQHHRLHHLAIASLLYFEVLPVQSMLLLKIYPVLEYGTLSKPPIHYYVKYSESTYGFCLLFTFYCQWGHISISLSFMIVAVYSIGEIRARAYRQGFKPRLILIQRQPVITTLAWPVGSATTPHMYLL